MAVPLSQVCTVAKYAITNTLKGRKKYPLVLMLEPLFQCNLACSGCGKIQYPKNILDMRMPKEKAWAAIEECGAPVVSIAGGEPLLHPEMPEMVEGFVKRKNVFVLFPLVGFHLPPRHFALWRLSAWHFVQDNTGRGLFP